MSCRAPCGLFGPGVGDAGLQGLVSDIAGAKAKAYGDDVALTSAQVTAVAGGGVPTDIAYIEQPNRTAALRVHVPGLTSDIGPGDLVLIQGGWVPPPKASDSSKPSSSTGSSRALARGLST